MGFNIYAQVAEQEYYDLEIPCKVLCKEDFIIFNKSETWRALDCKLSDFNFNKNTIIGLVRSTCGQEGGLVLKVIRDDKNKKYIIKTRFQKECLCKPLRHNPEVRVGYTKRLKSNYQIEYDYLKPSS